MDGRSAKPRIGLFGLFGCGNFGNDGSLESMLLFLRGARPSAELVCICADPDVVEEEYRLPSLPVDWPRPKNSVYRFFDRLLRKAPGKLVDLFHAFSVVKNVDVLIVPGTGILDDFREGPGGFPYALLRTLFAARLRGTKILLVSIGAGPIHHPVNRWLMKAAAGLAQYRSYRDTISKSFMDSIGMDTRNDPIYPDIAFALPEPQPFNVRQSAKSSLTVGIGVMAYNGWRNDVGAEAAIYELYLKKLTRFATWVMERGYSVRVLVGETTDQRAVDDLLQAVESKRRELGASIIAEPTRSLHDLMRQIAQTDVVVATRFHNVVCALKLGKPVVSIGYAEKNDALMADMGLGDFCQHIERLDVDTLIDQFTRLVEDRATYESKVRATSSAYQQRLARQGSQLLSTYLQVETDGVGEGYRV
jgi:polysaccharide pyruvyl transferase WcaK-like protein